MRERERENDQVECGSYGVEESKKKIREGKD